MVRKLLYGLAQSATLWVTVMLPEATKVDEDDVLSHLDRDYGPSFYRDWEGFQTVVDGSGVSTQLQELLTAELSAVTQVQGGKYLGSELHITADDLRQLRFGPFRMEVEP